jgi:hypothetical protein
MYFFITYDDDEADMAEWAPFGIERRCYNERTLCGRLCVNCRAVYFINYRWMRMFILIAMFFPIHHTPAKKLAARAVSFSLCK